MGVTHFGHHPICKQVVNYHGFGISVNRIGVHGIRLETIGVTHFRHHLICKQEVNYHDFDIGVNRISVHGIRL